MNKQIFLPPLDTRWRFTDGWMPEPGFLKSWWNEETLWAEGKNHIQKWMKETGDTTRDDTGSGSSWVSRMNVWEAEQKALRGAPQFVKGTVIQIERYHVSRSGENMITVKVLISPDKRLTPKKQGGIMVGAGRLYLTLNEFNSLPEIEEVDEMP